MVATMQETEKDFFRDEGIRMGISVDRLERAEFFDGAARERP